MTFETIQLIAGGTIGVCRFVKLSAAANFTGLQAGDNEAIIGVSTQAQQDAPTSGSDANAALTGDQISVHPIGSVCVLEAGSGGFVRGDELKSDANGKGVPRATSGTTNQNVGAIALESAAAGERARVLVFRSFNRPA